MPRLFLIGLSMMKTGQPDHLIGLCREIPGKPLPSFMFIWVSNFHSLACMLHQTNTWINRCFRCAGVFDLGFLLQTVERQTGADCFGHLETIVWLISRSLKCASWVLNCHSLRTWSFWCILQVFDLFLLFFLFFFTLFRHFRIWSIASALNTKTQQSVLSWIKKSLITLDSTGPKQS